MHGVRNTFSILFKRIYGKQLHFWLYDVIALTVHRRHHVTYRITDPWQDGFMLVSLVVVCILICWHSLVNQIEIKNRTKAEIIFMIASSVIYGLFAFTTWGLILTKVRYALGAYRVIFTHETTPMSIIC